jgi:putative FmdB family regulatory protein
MPIYAYKCSACGHASDVLQKMSDDPLTVCPSCGQSSYAKQLTAAGFQLKGSGWYVTDFRNNGKKPDTPAKTAIKGDAPNEAKSDKAAETKTEGASPAPATAPASDAKPAESKPSGGSQPEAARVRAAGERPQAGHNPGRADRAAR